MGWYRPLFGDGPLVWRDAATEPPRPASDEGALDAAIPGRAAIRERYAPTHDAADRAVRGASGAAAALEQQVRELGGVISPVAARDRVHQALRRAPRTDR